MLRLTRPFEFAGADGQKLAGRLDLPGNPPLAVVLFAHCFTCTKDYHAAARISRGLTDRGFAVLRFDFTGLGNSGGDFANTNFSSNVADLVSAAEALSAEIAPPRLLIGHSLGGAAVLKAAHLLPQVQAVATLAAPFEPSHLAWIVAGKEGELAATGQVQATIAGRQFTIKQQFLDDLARQQMQGTLATLGRPLMVLHDPEDKVVPIAEADQIMSAAIHPKSFVAVPKAGHMFGSQADAHYVAETIAHWAMRSLNLQSNTAKAAPAGQKKGSHAVRVEETRAGTYTNLINASGHLVTADEPVDLGGDDTGMTPHELLTAALGACTSITIRMYANRKGWPLERIAVDLVHEKQPAPEGTKTQNAGNVVDVYTRNIRFDGPLDEEQKLKLLEIADKCPVHRSLHSMPRVETVLVNAESVPSPT